MTREEIERAVDELEASFDARLAAIRKKAAGAWRFSRSRDGKKPTKALNAP